MRRYPVAPVSRPAALRAALATGGVVATVAGLHTAVAGARSVPGEGPANVAIESELRFYGVFYAAYGLALLRVASHPERNAAEVRALAATVFGAGVARAYGWAAAGAPHPVQRVLLAIELAAPPAILALQRD